MNHARARPAGLDTGELEPCEDRAGRALLVAEVEVVGLRRVEVDRLLHHPQPHQVGVEVDVSLGFAGDHRDVVACHRVASGPPVASRKLCTQPTATDAGVQDVFRAIQTLRVWIAGAVPRRMLRPGHGRPAPERHAGSAFVLRRGRRGAQLHARRRAPARQPVTAQPGDQGARDESRGDVAGAHQPPRGVDDGGGGAAAGGPCSARGGRARCQRRARSRRQRPAPGPRRFPGIRSLQRDRRVAGKLCGAVLSASIGDPAE